MVRNSCRRRPPENQFFLQSKTENHSYKDQRVKCSFKRSTQNLKALLNQTEELLCFYKIYWKE